MPTSTNHSYDGGDGTSRSAGGGGATQIGQVANGGAGISLLSKTFGGGGAAFDGTGGTGGGGNGGTSGHVAGYPGTANTGGGGGGSYWGGGYDGGAGGSGLVIVAYSLASPKILRPRGRDRFYNTI